MKRGFNRRNLFPGGFIPGGFCQGALFLSLIRRIPLPGILYMSFIFSFKLFIIFLAYIMQNLILNNFYEVNKLPTKLSFRDIDISLKLEIA